MLKSVRRAAVVVLAVPVVLGATASGAFAGTGLVTTPGATVPGPGASCVFIGQTTVYNPLSSSTLMTTDPNTGVYVNCNDVG